jgi:hypothetical protein
MNDRLHAAWVIARRRVRETLIAPGWYVALTVCLLLASSLVAGFVRSVDSGGFNLHVHPVYDLLGRAMEATFGGAVVQGLFAEGPFAFALHAAFLPMLMYLACSTVFRFGLERKVGALELMTYGPSDGTSWFLAFLIRDMLATLLVLLLLLGFLAVCASINNLVLGPALFFSLPALFLVALSVHSYGILASTIADHTASALAAFLALMSLFVVDFLGSFTIVNGYVRSLSAVLAMVLRWVSPVHYWDQALRGAGSASGGWYVLNLLLLAALSGVVLTSSHFILKARGVRS